MATPPALPTITLRGYQADMIQRARQAIARKQRRILLQAPTGAGKTAVASYMAAGTAAGGGDAWFICHRDELLEGTSNTFRKYGIPHGLIASGLPMDLGVPVQVCSMDTLKNRLKRLKPPRLAIIDECHHCNAAGWAMVVNWLHAHGTIIIGLSATPVRLDGQPLGQHFDELILGPKVAWLIENGFLSPYEIYAPAVPDMTGARRNLGDYSRTDAASRMNKAKLIGDAVEHWQRLTPGLKSIGFACNVDHSMHCVQLFRAAGIRAAHLDGTTPRNDRRNIVRAYANGRLDVLFNVGLFGEGFDLAAIAQQDVTIDCVIDMAPTMSLPAYMQRGGRMLRPFPGKIGYYLDHAGNSGRHGFFDDDREWTLDGKDNAASQDGAPPPPVTCPQCFMQIRQPVPDFCRCGQRLRQEAAPIKVEAGQLELQTEERKQAVRARLKAEQEEARTLDELVAVCRRQGHKHPQRRAMEIISARRPQASASQAPQVEFDSDGF